MRLELQKPIDDCIKSQAALIQLTIDPESGLTQLVGQNSANRLHIFSSKRKCAQGPDDRKQPKVPA